MFASWLLDAVCPFNVSYLTHIDLVSSMEPGVASILTGAQLTLQALTVTPCASLSDPQHCGLF
jgi:hypothetical protein